MVGFPNLDPVFQAMFRQRKGEPGPSPAKAIMRVKQKDWAVEPVDEWSELERDMIWDSLLIGVACNIHHPYGWIVNYELMCPNLKGLLESEQCIAALWTGWAKVYDMEIDALCGLAHTYAEENSLI